MKIFGFGKDKEEVEEQRERDEIAFMIREVNLAASRFGKNDALPILAANLTASCRKIIADVEAERLSLKLHSYNVFSGWQHQFKDILLKDNLRLSGELPPLLIKALERKGELAKGIQQMLLQYDATKDPAENHRRLALLLKRFGSIEIYSKSGQKTVADASYLMMMKKFFSVVERVIGALESQVKQKKPLTEAGLRGLMGAISADKVTKNHEEERIYLTAKLSQVAG